MNILVIKGGIADALAALEGRGMVAVTIVKHPRFEECIVTVAETTPWETLAKWFCAKGTLPFPVGTLLWYGPLSNPTQVPAPKGWDKVEGGGNG